jgi:hypothetical protein
MKILIVQKMPSFSALLAQPWHRRNVIFSSQCSCTLLLASMFALLALSLVQRFEPFFFSHAFFLCSPSIILVSVAKKRTKCQTETNAWRYLTPLPSVQRMFTHQLSVVATSLHVACHSPAQIFVYLSCTGTIQLGRTICRSCIIHLYKYTLFPDS